jgi:minor extracellular serine protease Vpr
MTNGFPWLAAISGTSYVNQPSGSTYTMADGNTIPYFLLHLDHLSRRVQLQAYDAVSGKYMGRIAEDQYVTRNSTPGGFFAYTWDGTVYKGPTSAPTEVKTVPNGQYVVKLSVQKALGVYENPADWETWNSPVITVARP